MTTLHTLIEKKEEEFDEKFLLEDSNQTYSGKRLVCDPQFAKYFLQEAMTSAYRKGVEDALNACTPVNDSAWGCDSCGGTICGSCLTRLQALTEHK
jgi:hypothetical protein